jgi:nucleotide sugar dehydrogenase
MKIGIIGQGFVGTAVNEGLKKYHKIETFDLIENKSTCKSIQELVNKTKAIFVCVPTPMQIGGSCYLGFVEEVLEKINEACMMPDGYGFMTMNVAIKSTIPPGTTEIFNKKYIALKISFNPEFLTEANSIEDFKNQNRIIIGGPRPSSTVFKRIYSKAFPKVPIIKTGSTTAEMVKYFVNCFLATKVSFANEMYQICEDLNIDYDKVTEYVKYDERIGDTHLNVPGPDGDFGYGGHCFPKDVKALISLAHDLNVSPRMLTATECKNNDVRTNRDWEKQVGRAIINK